MLIRKAETGWVFEAGHFDSSFVRLAEAVKAGFIYDKWNSVVSFVPDMALATGTAGVVLLSAFMFPEGFTSKLIIYISYLGIISMSIAQVIGLAFSVAGSRQSINRIRSV